jgi:hypothetical protein
MRKINLLIALIAIISFTASAQRSTRAKEADYKFLLKEKSLNILFTYEGMTVGKNMTEEAYVAKKVSEKNAKKPGTGDKWQKAWENGKLSVYEPAFKAGYVKKMAKSGIKVTEGDDARLTLIVKTTRIEPGFNIGITKMSAVCDYEFIFVETANKDNIVAQIVMSKMRGSDTYSVSARIQVAFMNAGRRLSGYTAKKLKALKK